VETVSTNTQAIESYLKDILGYIGDDPDREGLVETPHRIVKSWEKLFGGYEQNPYDVIKTFEDGACNEMVILKDIEFYSTCEHHFLPFFGKVHIAYIPNGKVVGVSKLARLVEVYARRLQIQERLVGQIADCISEVLNPDGVMVVCQAQHFCMISRGVEKQNSIMVTSAVRGVFKDIAKTREEFMSLISM
jgi:GTP cyclohydrolase IA